MSYIAGIKSQNVDYHIPSVLSITTNFVNYVISQKPIISIIDTDYTGPLLFFTGLKSAQVNTLFQISELQSFPFFYTTVGDITVKQINKKANNGPKILVTKVYPSDSGKSMDMITMYVNYGLFDKDNGLSFSLEGDNIEKCGCELVYEGPTN